MKLLVMIGVADKQPNGDILPEAGKPLGWATIEVDETTIPALEFEGVPVDAGRWMNEYLAPVVGAAFKGFRTIRDQQIAEAAAPLVQEPVRRIHLV